MKLFAFILFAMAFTACSKDDNCIDSIIGNYSGSLTTDFIFVEGGIIISKDTSGGSNLVIVDNLVNTGVVYTGTLSSDCKKITVPDQNIILPGGTLASIGGEFNIDGTAVTGSLILIVASTTHLTYNLTKM